MRHDLDRALWEADDEERLPIVREMTIGPVTTSDVDEFARRYHYTETGGSALWRWGLWSGVVLYGIVAYNLPTRTVQETVFGPEHRAHVWHMGRLAVADRAPLNSESRLVAGSLREIRRQHPDVWAVLSYAATDAGHLGYVYQATNAFYTGEGGDAIYHVDAKGRRHGTYLSGYVNAERAAGLGWTRHEGGTKHRYLYVLGTKTQRRARMRLLRLDVLPYPK